MTTDKKQKQTAKSAAGTALTGAAVPDKSAAASAAPSGKAPVYESGYSAQVQDSLDKILNREKFDYNVNEDKLFSQYKDSYEKAGRQAMQDTMGNAALLTGGYGNSYAATAGQQAYNSYMDKLADKIPELEAKAYSRYKDEESSAYDRLSALLALENTDYDRYRDRVSDYNSDRDFAYKAGQDKISQDNWQKTFDRNIYESDRDYSRDVYESDRDYSRDVYENDRDYQNSLYQSDRTYKLNLMKALAAESSSGSTGSTGGTGGNDTESTAFSPEDAYAFIKKYNQNIYSEEEFAETMYQLYGDKDGFYEWFANLGIPGDVSGRKYLDLLYEMHPELKPKTTLKASDREQLYRTAGAAIPASVNSWALQTQK